MTDKTIEISQQGLKCDADGCNYKYAFNETDTYQQYVDTPCPKCGANILTQEDCDNVMEVMNLLEYASSPEFVAPELPDEIQSLVDQLEEPDKKVKIKLEFIDGIPVMTSDDEEVQGILTRIEEYYVSQISNLAAESQKE